MLPVKRKPKTIDEYLRSVPGDRRRALTELRKTIRKIAPKTEECISYGMPAFRLDGQVIAGFAATAKGCSYFPFSGSTLATLADDPDGYGGTKSSLHFEADEGLPAFTSCTAAVRRSVADVLGPRRRVVLFP